MRIVGLSGGIACGKSTVARILREQEGVEVIDCDALSRATQRKGRWGYRRVVGAFGLQVVRADDGELDREALARIVFDDPAARRRLNAASHAPVAAALAWRLLWAWLRLRPLVVVDMPLLFETGAHRFASTTVVVAVRDEAQQVGRLVARDGLSEADARSRVAAQMPLALKVALADAVLDNGAEGGGGGGLEGLRGQVGRLAARLRRGAPWWRTALYSPYALGFAAAWALRRLPALMVSLVKR